MKFIPMPARRPSGRRAGGMTLPELMVALGVGSLVLMMMAVVWVSSNRSFAAMGNYIEMDRASRNALDQMTRDIRKAKNLITFATNRLVFNSAGATNLVYEYDPASGNLTAWKTGDTETNILLTGCSNLVFSMYRNIPVPGGDFTNTTIVAQGKGIGVTWKCSRTLLGNKFNSEDMQEAVIIIRNKPVL